jgi:hypothetical protein
MIRGLEQLQEYSSTDVDPLKKSYAQINEEKKHAELVKLI